MKTNSINEFSISNFDSLTQKFSQEALLGPFGHTLVDSAVITFENEKRLIHVCKPRSKEGCSNSKNILDENYYSQQFDAERFVLTETDYENAELIEGG